MSTFDLDKIEHGIMNAINANTSAIDREKAALATSEANMEAAKKDMEEALEASSEKEYSEARRRYNFEKDAVEMHRTRLDRLEKKTCFAMDEAKAIHKEILQGMEEINKDYQEKIADKLAEVLSLIREGSDIINHGNMVLNQLQGEAMKHPENVERIGGATQFYPICKRFENFSIVATGRSIEAMPIFRYRNGK